MRQNHPIRWFCVAQWSCCIYTALHLDGLSVDLWCCIYTAPKVLLCPHPLNLFLIAKKYGRQSCACRSKCSQPKDIESILTEENRLRWRLPNLGPIQFVGRLVEAKIIEPIELDFPGRTLWRYLWKKSSTYAVAQSLDEGATLRTSAQMHLHQLTDQVPKTIYFNIEQTRRSGGGELEQQAIDLAFFAHVGSAKMPLCTVTSEFSC